MGHQVQRKIEGTDKSAGPQRHPLGHAPITAGARTDLQGNGFTADVQGLVSRHLKRVDEAGDFALGILDGLASLDAQTHGQFIETRLELLRAMKQHIPALIGLQRRHGRRGFTGQRNGMINGLGIGQGNAGGHIAAELVPDLQIRIGQLRQVAQIERIALFQHSTGLLSSYSCPPRNGRL